MSKTQGSQVVWMPPPPGSSDSPSSRVIGLLSLANPSSAAHLLCRTTSEELIPTHSNFTPMRSISFHSHETVKKYPAPLAARLIKVDPRVLPCGSLICTHTQQGQKAAASHTSRTAPAPCKSAPGGRPGSSPLLPGNAPEQALWKMPATRTVRVTPCLGPAERCCWPSPSAGGDLRHVELLGLLGLHRVPHPGSQPALLACLVHLQHLCASRGTGLIAWPTQMPVSLGPVGSSQLPPRMPLQDQVSTHENCLAE